MSNNLTQELTNLNNADHEAAQNITVENELAPIKATKKLKSINKKVKTALICRPKQPLLPRALKFVVFKPVFQTMSELVENKKKAASCTYFLNCHVDLPVIRDTLEAANLSEDTNGTWTLFWTCSALKPQFFICLKNY